MNLHKRTRHGGLELFNTQRLRARLIMCHYAPRREIQRKVLVRLFSREVKLHRMKTRPPIGSCKPVEKKARRARMLFARARPKHAVFIGNPLITDTRVIGHPTGGSTAQLTKRRACL